MTNSLSYQLSERQWIPNYPGIYVFLKDDVPMYIGQSGALKERILQGVSKFEKYGVTEIRIIHCEDRRDRLRAETYLLQRFKPLFNQSLISSTCDILGIHPIAPEIAAGLRLIETEKK